MLSAEELKEIFESEFNPESWKRVLVEVFGLKLYNIKPQKIGTTPNDWEAEGFELGNFVTIEGRLVGVYEVKINEKVRLQYNKVGLRNLLKPIYNEDVDAALVVFNQKKQWRFSYVSEIRIKNKETGKREKKATDSKRYTYLFGKGQQCRTPSERFGRIQQQYNLFGEGIGLDDIEKAFSVDSLTKDFYRELSDWYFRALKEVVFPDDSEKDERTRNATNTIRLITRLIFVWFFKQKGIVPEELFDKKYIDTLINYQDKTGSTYYKAILQNLFFATLNTDMGDSNRKFVNRQYGIQGYYRYIRFFKDPEKLLEITKNIPFLNGGLFENLDKNIGEPNEIRIDCFSNAKENETRLVVPDSLFFSTENVDLSDDYGDNKKKSQKVRGLLEILKSYNFTIEENTPFEIEVALDPELLGKVFENLLASYVPETQSTARKMTGSFYTPREIVDYMVDESLKAYLKYYLNKSGYTKNYEDQINQLFSYSTDPHPFNNEECHAIISAIDNAKILDPACGSGAYPMGMLHKMVHILHKLDPKNEEWEKRQLLKVDLLIHDAEKINDYITREKIIADLKETRRDVEEAFENNELDYGRKLFLIENCIYGVDIQPIAVQIAKLRFFISLIVDQQINSAKKNLGVRPLPNLETKFVAANTLLKLDKPKQLLLRNPRIVELETELNEVRHKHFSARTPRTKQKWRERDYELRNLIASFLESDGWGNKVAGLIANWNPYDQNTSAGFFDSEWMFGILDGFDIVIGNPPYISLQRMEDTEALRKVEYKTFEKTGDLYSLFYEQGINLLKRNGILCYITSNKWINANYGKSTRRYFATYTNPLILIDFAKVKIFEAATVFVNILILEKAKNQNYLQACTIEGTKLPEEDLYLYLSKHKFILKDLDENIWKVNNAISHKINLLIEEKGTKLVNWKYTYIYRGLTTGLNEAFHLTKDQRTYLLNKDAKNTEIIKPLLRGKDIKRWRYEFDEWYVINTHNGLKGLTVNLPPVNVKRDYPEIYNYLSDYKNELIGRQDQGIHWTNLRDCAFMLEFEKPKIVWIEISNRANYAYDESGMFLTNSAYFMTGRDLKYILAVLNSKVADFYFSQLTATIAGGRKRYTKQYVEQIPIPQISEQEQKPFIKIVDYILVLKNHDHNIEARNALSHFESILETMVYELYFEELVKKKGLELIKWIEKLPEVDELIPERKLSEIILQYEQTYEKDHPVRNSIFFIDSIPEIREITSTIF